MQHWINIDVLRVLCWIAGLFVTTAYGVWIYWVSENYIIMPCARRDVIDPCFSSNSQLACGTGITDYRRFRNVHVSGFFMALDVQI
jgi:hypothetical protein